MIWKSKHPPIYCFVGDYWVRETDKMIFSMLQDQFMSKVESIPYTKKNKVFILYYTGKNSEIERWKRVI